ncbi:MAG: extracellular solute-binding protein [Clostridiales bacterium]|nr:extracellular solute-binding protein [Clostridiales bacterium]
MKKRFLLLISVIMVCSLMLVGCGGNNDDGKSTGQTSSNDKQADNKSDDKAKDDDKVIEFWNIGTEGHNKEIYDLALKQFNENTKSGYTVKMTAIQNDKYKEQLVIAMSSGEAPDMYSHWTGGPMIEYIESGFAQPLDDLYDKYGVRERYIDGALAQSSYDGKLYAVPVKGVSVAGIYYNKDLFAKYNLEVPTTLSQLEAACDTFVENGIIPFALANGPKWTGSMYFQNLVARKGGLEPFKNAAAGNGSFEDEVFTYAGEKIQEWVNKGYFPDGFNAMSEDDGQARQLFYREDAAMYLIGSWGTATFQTETKESGTDFYDKIGWFSFPAIEGSDADPSILCGTLGDNFISFNCTDEKLEAAFEFASYLSTAEMLDYFVNNGIIPVIHGADGKITDEITNTIAEAAANAAEVQLWYDQYLSPSIANAHLDGNQEVFGLTKTPQEANKMMQDALEEELSK